ncbi:thiamine pyrophosphate-dependent enzyme, partial [Hoeflea alexandrii]
GSRLELQYFRWRWMPKGLKVVRVDIDPTEMVRLKPDVGLVTESAAGVRALIDELKGLPVRSSRQAELAKLKADATEALTSVQPQEGYLRVIRDVLPRDGFFVEEVSQVGFTARMCFPVYAARHYVTCGYQDNLGFGFNTALGVKIANPDKAVVSVSGDGGFMFGVQELATAKQFGIAVVAIVFNNQAYGNVRRDQQTVYGNRLLGADLENPDFVALAKSFGVMAMRADSPEELRGKLAEALDANEPVVIEVSIPRGSDSSPWPFIHPAPLS